MTRLLIALALFCPASALAQDSAQVARLEQEVRQLQREVLTLSQLVAQLRLRVENPQLPSPATTVPSPSRIGAERSVPAATRTADKWINAAAWRGLRLGMSELEVISALGSPATTRGVEPERVLLYALEIGPTSFLSGSVTLRDHAVVAIETPVLK